MDNENGMEGTAYVLAIGSVLLGVYTSVQEAEDGYLDYRNSRTNPQKLFCDWEERGDNTHVCMDDLVRLAGTSEYYPTISGMEVNGKISG